MPDFKGTGRRRLSHSWPSCRWRRRRRIGGCFLRRSDRMHTIVVQQAFMDPAEDDQIYTRSSLLLLKDRACFCPSTNTRICVCFTVDLDYSHSRTNSSSEYGFTRVLLFRVVHLFSALTLLWRRFQIQSVNSFQQQWLPLQKATTRLVY